MRLQELLETISPEELIDIQDRLNSMLYMPDIEMKRRGPVIKLDLGHTQHMGGRAGGDRGRGSIDFTADELEDLLKRARADKRLGYSGWIDKQASYNGKSDIDPNGNGYRVKDAHTGLLVPFVVKPNPDKTGELNPPSPTTIQTDNGIEPRNIFKAKTIWRDKPGWEPPIKPSTGPSFMKGSSANNYRPKIDPVKGRFASNRARKSNSYDDGL